MNRIFSIILILLSSTHLFAQKEDYVWMTGKDTLNRITFSETGDYVLETRYNQPYWIDFTNVSMSDENGELLYYTNGRAIYDYNDSLIENGDSINYGVLWEFWVPEGGFRSFQGLLTLKLLNNNDEYGLFHINVDTSGAFIPPKNLLYTEIEKFDDSLSVVLKNEIVIIDTFCQGGLTACRHGNGRDWWIIAAEINSNCYYYGLLTPNGVSNFQKQCIGKFHPFNQEIVYTTFSPNGSMMLRGGGGQGSNTDTLAGVEIFDFDRCTGQLSNPRRIPHIELADTSISQHYWGQISVSPNSRFLYVSNASTVMQFDLWETNLLASKIIIHERDTTLPIAESFLYHQLAPNGKIYIANGAGGAQWHIIHNPNAIGLACSFENAVPLPHVGSLALPNFPNYRLGALIGSPCDTLGDTIDVVNQQEIERNLNVYPNPANQVVRIEYGNFLWSSTNHLQLQITNLLGQEVYFTELPQYSLYKDLNTQELGSGTYFVNIYQGNELVGVRKLVVENE